MRQGQTDPTVLELVNALAMGQLEIARKVVLKIFEWVGRLLIEETSHCGNERKRAETVSETSDLVSCWSKAHIRPHVGAGLSQVPARDEVASCIKTV